MKTFLAFAAICAVLGLSGCASDQTSSSDVTATAKQFQKEAEGKPTAPPPPGLQNMGGGGPAPATGPKGIGGK